MQIIPYDAQYKQDFIDFNTDWIVDNFGFLEEEDLHTFDTIEEKIERGGMVFFAVNDGVCLATCMTYPMDDGIWEICKLASNKHYEHKGCGTAVFERSMQWAIEHGAKKLFMLSNRNLKAAMHIYARACSH